MCNSSQFGFNWCLPGIRLKLWVLRKNTTQVNCPSHYIIQWGTCNEHNLSVVIFLDLLIKVVFARFLHCKVTILPFSYSVLWKGVTKTSAYVRVGNYLYQYGLMYIYFYTLDFVTKFFFQLWSLEACLGWLPVYLICLHPVVFWALPYFLTL